MKHCAPGSTRRNQPPCGDRARQGVSLVIALGTLAVFSLLVLTFAAAMRSRRVVARAAVDDVRAHHLLYAALSRSVAHVSQEMAGHVYPAWPSGEALPSPGTSNCLDAVTPEALALVPASLWSSASNVSPGWVYAVSTTTGETNGRVAWVAVNCSGLIDANRAGGEPRRASTNIAELDLASLPDLNGNTPAFYANRDAHRRYESVDELARANSNELDRPIADMFVYSYDPGRDAYFTAPSELGSPVATFPDKLPINNSTNVAGVAAVLASAGFANATDLAWNIRNYLDADRIPQGNVAEPWLSPTFVEAVPLLNEVVVREVGGAAANTYELAVELWFPFVPASVDAADGFRLEVGVFSNALTQAEAEAELDSASPGAWSFKTNISTMAYGGPAEFVVAASPSGSRIAVADPSSGANLPLGSSNTIWFLARVVTDVSGSNAVVDQAWGPEPLPIDATGAWSVDDPRVNGRRDHWVAAVETLGQTNATCTAWDDPDTGEGLPIYHRDGPMLSIGELGHIYAPAVSSVWRNVDLYSAEAGLAMDRLTVRGTNAPSHGLVAVGTGNTNVQATLLNQMPMGYSNASLSVTGTVDMLTALQTGAALARGGPYENWADFTARTLSSGPYASVAEALKACATNTVGNAGKADVFREAALQGIVELVTFRQNIFALVLVAEALGANGRTPVAREQAVAIVYRDAYTGRTFLRSLRRMRD